MRKIPTIEAPSYSERTVTIEDFLSVTKSAYNITATKSGLMPERLAVQKVASLPSSQVDKLFFENGSLFAYTKDGQLLEFDGKAWVKVLDCDSTPKISRVLVDGEWRGLCCTENSSRVFTKTSNVEEDIPYGDVYENFKYRLFVGKDNVIKYSAFADRTKFNGTSDSGALYTDILYGKIVGMFSQKDKLVVVCEKTIYHLYIANGTSGFSLVKQDVDLDLTENSVVALDGKVYMLNRKEFCVYDGSDVKKVQTLTDLSDYSFKSQPCAIAGAIYFVVSNGVEDNLFVYDCINQTDMLMPSFENLTSEGYLINDKGVYKLKPREQDGDALWESVPLDLASPYKKALMRFSVRAEGRLDIDVIGTYSKSTFKFEGSGVAIMNIPSYAYKIVIRLNSKAKVQNMKFVYRIKEER